MAVAGRLCQLESIKTAPIAGHVGSTALFMRKNIKSKNEIMPMDRINDAINKVKEGKARYRMVLKN